MELGFLQRIFEDKQIMNPLNPEEVFTCKDLTDDYHICRKERRLQTTRDNNIKQNCSDYRRMAMRCYYMEEDEFVDMVLDKYDKRTKYAEYLESEGSVLADSYRQKETLFRLRNQSSVGSEEAAAQQQPKE